MSRPTNPLQRVTAGLTAGLLVVSQLSFPTRAEAALGSSTASAGSALPPSMTAIESFQPDLFTGRATTSISIAVPPGRKGMQPNLALTYSSSARNGWVGVGWSLDTGYIERNTKKGVPTYTATDTFTFMLQGVASDLVQLSDGTFRAKDEGLFLRFQNNGGSGWEVRDKSGTRYLFGQTAASQIASAGQVFRWSLDKVIDVNGNNMILTYTKDQGQLYLDQIDYTGFEGTGPSPASSVKLTPESRTDVETSYRSGFSVTTAKRLQSIEAKTMVNSVLSPARRYDFEYAYSPRTGRSLLTGVTQVGTDGVTSLPATSFGYQDTDIPGYSMSANNPTTSSPGWNIRRASLDTGHENFGCVHPYSGLSWTQPEVVTGTSNFPCLSASVGSNGSVTMNGCQDNFGHAYVFVYNNSARTLSVPASPLSDVDGCVWREDASGIQNMGSGSSIPVQAGWTVLHITAYHQHQGWGIAMSTALTSQVTLMSPAQFIQPQISGDFDGNGMTDLATFTPSSGKWVVSLSQGSSFSPETTWLSSGFGNSASTPLVGDWNADGRTDIAVYDDGAWRFAMSTGSAFQENTGAFLYAYAAGKPFAGDFNGDGILDVGAYTPNTDVKWSVALGTGSNFVPTSSLNSFVGTSTTLPLTGDFNGDGLTDIAVLTQSSAEIDVQLSTGSGWTSAADWVPNPYWTGQKATTADINGDGLTDIVYYINASARVFWARSTGTHFEFVEALPPVFSDFVNSDPPQVGDFNGDGLADPAVFNATTGASELAKSQGTFPDLLSSISNGLGGTTALHYQPSSQVPSLPFVIPIVDQVTISDGLSNSYTTTYAYESGVYDASAREFRGFGRVQMRDAAGMITATSFHQDAVKKGRPFQIEVSDTMGDPWTTTEHTWNETTPYPGIDAHAVQLAETVVTDFDGDDDVFHEVRSRFEYDSYGNVTAAYEDGEIIGGVADAVNKRSTVTTYTTPNTTDWILNKPNLVQMLNGAGVAVAKRQFYYDGTTSTTTAPTKGNLTKEEEWLNPGNRWLPTTLTYDPYGNVWTVKDALNRTTTNTYDTNTKTYLTKITNTTPFQHTRELTYDARFGQVTLSKDQNLVPTSTEYDVFGRVKKVIGPNDSSAQPTIEYDYDLTTNPSKTTVKTRIQSGQPNLLTAYSFTDGLGRTIQTRAPAEDTSKQVVTGAVEFNTQGQVVKQWVSYLGGISSSYVPAPVASLASPVEYTYDPAGRVLRTTNPDGSVAETAYDDWGVTSTDANGEVTRRFNDAYGRLVKVEEVNGSATYATTYVYDTLNNLTKVTDQAGNITTITYDSLGRKISMSDPDMGNWLYAYDDVDNLTSQTDARGVQTAFTYDALNRLKTKSYSSLPAGVTNPGAVTYTYDQVTAQNFGKGKLTSITDGSGSSSFEYDNLGRLIKETKNITGDSSYTITRAYDLLGRLTSLTYPDSEIATYTYNAQSGIETVTLAGQPIISGMIYNAADQIEEITYGNGIKSKYAYDPDTLRLDTLKTGPGTTASLQDFKYHFDDVGNVTQIDDFVHTADQTFTYDALHRLTQAQGAYGTLNYSYDPIGNMTSKEGVTMTYGAGPAGPHAVTGLDDGTVLTYDVNGNLKQKTKDAATLATYTWDAENRLTQVAQVPPETTVQVTLQAGWNFFALPVELSLSTNVDTTSIAQVSRYTNGTWEHWVNDPEFNDFELWEMEPGVGYQVYCTDAVQLNLTGKPISGLSKSLTAGWHLLGATNATGTLTPAGWLAGVTASQVKKLADASGTLATATQIDPGQAYWVQIGTGGTWSTPAPPQQVTSFAYDGDGGRVKQTVGGTTTFYLGETYEKTGSTTTKYVFAGSQRLAAKDTTGLRFYHGDHLGSSNIITNGAGQLVELNENTPFGGTSRHEGSTNVPHKFTGQRLDQTGLYFYQARYYDPQLGRFIQADTIVPAPGDPQALNRYSYVRNNPIKYIDPSGHGFFSRFWRAIVGVVTAAVAIVLPPLAPAMWAVNVGISAATAIQTGNIAGLAGGLVGGAVFGAIGQGFAQGMAASLGGAAWNAVGGAVMGAAEFGIAGFGSGFGAALASGAGFRDSFRAGGAGAAAGAAMGAAIQGSYMAGWQDTLHGNSYAEVAGVQGQAALQAGRPGDLAGIGTALRTRTRGHSALYLHGTNAKGAAGIKASRQLDPWSWVTQPHAIDAMTGKPAIMLNPAQYRAFTGIPSYDKGEYLALIVAPSSTMHPRGLSEGGAPQWQVYGKHEVLAGSPYRNPNE